MKLFSYLMVSVVVGVGCLNEPTFNPQNNTDASNDRGAINNKNNRNNLGRDATLDVQSDQGVDLVRSDLGDIGTLIESTSDTEIDRFTPGSPTELRVGIDSVVDPAEVYFNSMAVSQLPVVPKLVNNWTVAIYLDDGEIVGERNAGGGELVLYSQSISFNPFLIGVDRVPFSIPVGDSTLTVLTDTTSFLLFNKQDTATNMSLNAAFLRLDDGRFSRNQTAHMESGMYQRVRALSPDGIPTFEVDRFEIDFDAFGTTAFEPKQYDPTSTSLFYSYTGTVPDGASSSFVTCGLDGLQVVCERFASGPVIRVRIQLVKWRPSLAVTTHNKLSFGGANTILLPASGPANDPETLFFFGTQGTHALASCEENGEQLGLQSCSIGIDAENGNLTRERAQAEATIWIQSIRNP